MNTALPPSIQKQLAAAEALEQQIAEQASPDQTPPAAQPTAPEPTPQAAPVVAETPQPQQPQPRTEDPAWAERYRTLEGKYRAEVPRLHQQNKELQTQLSTMSEQVAALTAQMQAAQAAPAKDATVTDDDREEFGEKLVDFVTRAALAVFRRESASLVSDIRQDIQAVRSQTHDVATKVVENEEDKFWSRVVELVPDWDEIDNNPEWAQWLGGTPDYSDISYRDQALVAVRKRSAEKLANLVKLWRGPVPASPAPSAAPQPVVETPKDDLSRQVAPPKTGTASSVPLAIQTTYTGADYAYWNDPRRARDTEASVVQANVALLEQALAENRIVW